MELQNNPLSANAMTIKIAADIVCAGNWRLHQKSYICIIRKRFLQDFFSGKDMYILEKVQKQGRDERTQHDYLTIWNGGEKERQQAYPTSKKKTADVESTCLHTCSGCRAVFLSFFRDCSWVLSSLPCFCTFFGSILTWDEVFQKKTYSI